MRQTNAIVMDRHGAITLGRDLDEAYNRLEAMEHAAKITHAARVLGPVAPLPPHEVDKLQSLAKQLGIPRAPDPCTLCNACPNGTGGPVVTPSSTTPSPTSSSRSSAARPSATSPTAAPAAAAAS